MDIEQGHSIHKHLCLTHLGRDIMAVILKMTFEVHFYDWRFQHFDFRFTEIRSHKLIIIILI